MSLDEEEKVICNYRSENYPKLTDWKKEPTVTQLMNDKEAADSSRSSFISCIEGYREDFDGGPEIQVRKGKSRIRPLVIRKNWEWKKPALEEPFLNTPDMLRVQGRTYDDVKVAEDMSTLLNYYIYAKSDKVRLVGDIVDTFGIDGTVFVKVGWNAEYRAIKRKVEKEVYATAEQSLALIKAKVKSGEMSREEAMAYIQSAEPIVLGTTIVEEDDEVLVENHPTFEVIDNYHIRVDPTCNGILEDARYIIHDFDLAKDEIIRDAVSESNPDGLYKNIDLINWDDDNLYEDNSDRDGYYIDVTDKSRKKIRVYQYWGRWDTRGDGHTQIIVATFIGKTMIRLEYSPFSHGRLPFVSAKFMPVRNSLYGQPNGYLIKDNQESIGKLLRAAHDITATNAVGQRIVNEQLFSPTQWEDFVKGNDTKHNPSFDPKTSITQMSVEPVNNSLFQMLSLYQAEAESLTGVKSFDSGISGQALGATATGIRSSLDATSKRELSILRRLANLFRDLGRQTIVNIQDFARDEEIIRITDNNFITIKKNDLKGEFDLTVDISTPEKDADTADKLNMLMQTNAASMDPNISKTIYAKIAKLWNQHDLVKDIEEVKPPEPSELDLIQIENAKLENQLLTMNIAKAMKDVEEADGRLAERDSRAKENEIDMINKMAQAEERKSRSRYYDEQADKLAHEFVNENDGVTRQRQIDDMTYKSQVEAEKQYYDQESKNK